MKKHRQYLLAFSSILLLVPNFLPQTSAGSVETRYTWEKYNPELNRLSSVDQLIQHGDSIAAAKNISDTLEYCILMQDLLKSKFYHGYSSYSLKENWIAAAMGRSWEGFSTIVVPDDIMKYPSAACSQQAIVLMKIFKQKGIDFRTLLFDNHFAVEGLIGNSWHYFDPDLEADLKPATSAGIHELTSSGRLFGLYNHIRDSAVLNYYLSNNFSVGEVNSLPGETAFIYQMITKVLSGSAWLFPLLLLLVGNRRSPVYVQRQKISSKGSIRTNITEKEFVI